MSVIDKFLFGWNELEPVLLSCLANGDNFLLIGKHGSGKTSFVRFMASALAEKEKGKPFVVTKYNMDKESMLSMVGCPSPEALAKGKFEFSIHERSVLKADAILMDEITRASKDNQNMVLEILEEKTVFGMPLKYRFVAATANDHTYKGAMKLDAALLDRFVAVIPIPDAHGSNDMAAFGAEEIAEVIRLNYGARKANKQEANEELVKTILAIRKKNRELWKSEDLKDVRENVIDFASKFMSQLINALKDKSKGSKEATFISLRQIGNHFIKLIMSMASYYRAIKNDPEYLKSAAWETIKYTLVTKLGISSDLARPIFDNLKDLLTDGDVLVASVKIGLTSGKIETRVNFVEEYEKVIREHLDAAETINVLGNIVQESSAEDIGDLVRLNTILEDTNISAVALNQVKLKLFGHAVENCLIGDVVSL